MRPLHYVRVFRWSIVTAIGCAYAFVAPRSFYKRRPK